MKKILLIAVIMAVLFMSGCGENKNPNALPDNGAGAMMPDNGTMLPDNGTGTTVPESGVGMTPDNSGIIGNAY